MNWQKNKIMMKIACSILFSLIYITTNSQILVVRNALTHEPLDLVLFYTNNPNIQHTTNSKGEIDISVFAKCKNIFTYINNYKSESYDYLDLKNKTEILLEPINIDIDEIIVSANRFNQISSEVPIKIETINPKQIFLHNPQTAADLLNITGGVFVQKSQQGGGSPMIRGFAANRLLYSVDGVRMNTAIFRSGNIQNVISLDPFAMENVEVLFGPGSVIYGSDAIGGVMSFQTLVAELSASKETFVTGKAVARHSTANNEQTFHFDINVGWKKFAMLTSISSNNYGHLKMGTNGHDEYLCNYYITRQNNKDIVNTNPNPLVQQPTGYSQINIMQKLRFKPNTKWNLSYGVHYSETSEYGRYDRHIKYKNNFPTYAEWNYGPQKWLMNNINVKHNNTTFLYDRLNMRIAQQYFEESRITRKINSNNRRIREEKVDAYSVNLDFSKSLSENNTIFYGAEYVLNNVNSEGTQVNIENNKQTPIASRYPKSIWQSYGVYLTNKYLISEILTMQTGIRYSGYILNSDFKSDFYSFPFSEAKINDSKITGSAGFVLNTESKWLISLNLSTGFRSPNVDDIGKIFDSEPGFLVVPNPNLKAEYAYNADLSVTKVFADFIKINCSAFYSFLDNALVRRDFTFNGVDSLIYDGELSRVQAIQNAAKANVYGFQAKIELKLPENFSIKSNLNYQKGYEELDDGSISPARHTAPFFSITGLSYKANKLSVNLNVIFNGRVSYNDLPESMKNKNFMFAKDINGNPYSPQWYTLNLRATYRLTDIFSIFVGLENITNQRYRPYSSGIASAGRNMIFSLKAKF